MTLRATRLPPPLMKKAWHAPVYIKHTFKKCCEGLAFNLKVASYVIVICNSYDDEKFSLFMLLRF